MEVAADGVLTVWVRENAVDGKANAALAEVLAEHFQVSKSAVELIRGQSGRQKTFRVTQK